MKLIVGLGNPGDDYQKTRHNLGFMVVDQMVKELNCPPMGLERRLKSEIIGCQVPISPGQSEPVLLIKPQTYMNQSGEAVRLALNYYNDRLTIEDLWVIHDDVDLPLGRLKIQLGGGTGGHHGLESIVSAIGYGFARFRLGLGRPKKRTFDVEDFVLKPFPREELAIVSQEIAVACQAVKKSLQEGIPAAMNQYNG